MKNSFKELEALEIEKLDAAVNRVQGKVSSNLGVFRFFGDVTELFIPRILQLFTSLLSDNKSGNPENKYPNLRG